MYHVALSALQGSLGPKKQVNVLNVLREHTKMNQEWDLANNAQREHSPVKVAASPSENVYPFVVMELTVLQDLFLVSSAKEIPSVVFHQLMDLKNVSIVQPTIIPSSLEHKTWDNAEKCVHLEPTLIPVSCLVHHAQ